MIPAHALIVQPSTMSFELETINTDCISSLLYIDCIAIFVRANVGEPEMAVMETDTRTQKWSPTITLGHFYLQMYQRWIRERFHQKNLESQLIYLIGSFRKAYILL
jgi:hypothetical protein